MEINYKALLKSSIFYILIALSSVVYVLAGMIFFKGGEKTFEQIVAEGFVYFLFGVLMHRMFEQQGIINGKSDENYKKTIAEYSNKLLSVTTILGRLESWCDRENAKALKTERTYILAGAGLSYDDCFDEHGLSKELYFKAEKPEGKLSRYQKSEYRSKKKTAKIKNRAFKKAVNVKIYKLSTTSITNGIEKSNVDGNMNVSLKSYLAVTSAKDIIVKFILTFLFGYFTYEVVQDISPGLIIHKVLMVFTIIIIGVTKMHAIEQHIKETEASIINHKTMKLIQFENDMKEQSI